jgi:hypothetical protein
LTGTDNFTRTGTTQTDFIVMGVVPEPTTLTLCAIALLAIAAMALTNSLRVSTAGKTIDAAGP